MENTQAAIRIADALLEAGFTPLIPHLTLAWRLVSPKPYAAWRAYDRRLLARCDVLLRVPGGSNGTTQESTFAEDIGIPVVRPRSADPADCVASVAAWFAESMTQVHFLVLCHRCSDESPGCGDCCCCHVCCRCGGRG